MRGCLVDLAGGLCGGWGSGRHYRPDYVKSAPFQGFSDAVRLLPDDRGNLRIGLSGLFLGCGVVKLGGGQRIAASQLHAAPLRRVQSGLGSLRNLVAFVFGQHRDDVKEQFPLSAGRVDVLRQRLHADSPVAKVFHGFDQVQETAAKSIKSPQNKRVAGLQGIQAIVKGWAAGLGAAYSFILKDTFTPCRLQSLYLHGCALFARRNTGISVNCHNKPHSFICGFNAALRLNTFNDLERPMYSGIKLSFCLVLSRMGCAYPLSHGAP